MAIYAYLVAGYLILAGIVRSRHLVHAIVCLSIAQAGTYVLLMAIGYQRGKATAPVYGSTTKPNVHVVDPVVQAMTLTDIVVSATVTALLLALAIQINKRHGTVDPDDVAALKG
jgi:multicomponent Na+:H+ antiporter subunit C